MTIRFGREAGAAWAELESGRATRKVSASIQIPMSRPIDWSVPEMKPLRPRRGVRVSEEIMMFRPKLIKAPRALIRATFLAPELAFARACIGFISLVSVRDRSLPAFVPSCAHSPNPLFREH